MQRAADTRAPRLAEAVLLQALLLASAAVLLELPRTLRQKPPEPPPPQQPKPAERQLRVIFLRAPPPAPPLKRQPAPEPKPPDAVAKIQSSPAAAPQRDPPAPRPPEPPAAKPSPQPPPSRDAANPPARPVREVEAAAAPAPPAALAAKPAPVRIAADSTSVHGVRMRVLVPRSPELLAAHLRNSGGCMVVSSLSHGSAEVLSVIELSALGALLVDRPPCSGVPRLLRDAELNLSLGDPLGRVRAQHPDGDLALQVILSPQLPALAQAALGARFGAGSDEEVARRAAAANYELTCFAEPEGPLHCQ